MMSPSSAPNAVATALFSPRESIEFVEEGVRLAPKFCERGLLPCITTDADSGQVLMLGWMDTDALALTLRTAEAHYWSRSRQQVWRKGATSGLAQHVVEARIDDDQDALWLRVRVQGLGASCHVGYRSCFYRSVPIGQRAGGTLSFTEDHKVFDPVEVYGDAPNPTQL
ncbi:MAG: phosphoribosyl-AMP cyclohydrolase [Hydrogenophaga sp.]|uniref:phosphoribosyl-AMP cyclohydrolase n=1 Tax=Hydrogenophaga sp. TaxID=1904254 RepID=UPI002ABD0F41|nr:phosphoribosyl-AMP cyclohydrolase [Hydrogenophaga sp.]MDZ4282959.1 phosphoribosyl-AMP cyclohydrolase [Hydrogenophaga sp.]